ncbi:hypothetical protein CP993_21195 [Escherichia coli]|nr:hypothetical protein CP993_21195 [Escherichia coli]
MTATVCTVTNRWRSKRGDIEPSIMLDGCTLSNTVKPEHVSGFTVWGNSRRSLKWYAGLFHVKE